MPLGGLRRRWRRLFSQPNGLCFSPDESLLHVDDSDQANVRVFGTADGKLTNTRLFPSGFREPDDRGVPDGLKCDAKGNICVTTLGGLWICPRRVGNRQDPGP